MALCVCGSLLRIACLIRQLLYLNEIFPWLVVLYFDNILVRSAL